MCAEQVGEPTRLAQCRRPSVRERFGQLDVERGDVELERDLDGVVSLLVQRIIQTLCEMRSSLGERVCDLMLTTSCTTRCTVSR